MGISQSLPSAEDLEFIFQKKVEEIITINIWIRKNKNNNYDVLSIYCEALC